MPTVHSVPCQKDCFKHILEEISALDQKKVHLENLVKDVRTESDKLRYDVVKANKFVKIKTTLQKSHAADQKCTADQRQKELDSCIEKRQKLEKESKPYFKYCFVLYIYIF